MRLTKRDRYGKAFAVAGDLNITKGSGIEHKTPDMVRGKIVDKLAAYEDVCDVPSKVNDKNVISDIVCPNCGSTDTTIYGTDEIEFDSDGTGHYFADCTCYRCEKSFRTCYRFKYEITDSYMR